MRDLNYILGLDLGVASLGWSVIECELTKDGRTSPKRIIDLGVRLWNKVGDPKTGESPAVKRREARSVRRRLRRRRRRLDKVIELLLNANIINNKEEIYSSIESPWELRVKALGEVLSGVQLGKAILHIAKRRGYKSNRRGGKEKEVGPVLEATKQNRELMAEKGYRTVGEMFYTDKKFTERKRNTTDSYLGVVERELLEEEIKLILDRQSSLGNSKLTEIVKSELFDAIFFQLPFLDKTHLESLIGKCEFFLEEPRAPKNIRTAELFVLYSKLNNLRIQAKGSFDGQQLNVEQKTKISDLVLRKGEVKYSDIRKILDIPIETSFNISYRRPKNATKDTQWEDVVKDTESKTWFVRLKGVTALSKALKKVDPDLLDRVNTNQEFADSLIEILVFNKEDASLTEAIKELNPDISSESLDALLGVVEFKGFSHLSKKALNLILPEMMDGLMYSDAVVKAIPEDIRIKSGNRSKYLPEIDTDAITNFNVIRALAQSRVVINAIVKEYGSPLKVHIELARDISKTEAERREIEKMQSDNRTENERITNILKETFGVSAPKGKDILKYKLWQEQDSRCAYSMKPIEAARLFSDDSYTQIDHILPWSRSLDDSYLNQALVLTTENQHKRDKTVYEYLGADESKWKELVAWWRSIRLPIYKIDRLQTTDFASRDIKEFLERDLNDTRYISRYLKNLIETHLEFRPAPFKRRVFVFKGRFTAMLRKYLGVNHLKVREESNRHHALDAVIVGIADSSMQQRMTEFFKRQEENTAKVKEHFPNPWPFFNKDLEIRVFADNTIQNDLLSYKELADLYTDIIDKVKPIIVSRKSDRKYTGAAHKETINTIREVDDKKVIVKRISINKLKKEHFEEGLIYGDDSLVIEVLRQRMEQNDWDAEKAFKEPVYKPTKNGKQGNVIKRIKVIDGPASSYVRLPNGGVAAQDNMFRIDVFQNGGKFFIVPVYISQINSNSGLPTKAILAHKDESLWNEVDERDFLFSLYPHEYISIKTKSNKIEGYYASAHRGTGSIKIFGHERSADNAQSIGLKTAKEVIKYYISPLGRKYALSRENERKRPWRTEPSI